MSQTNQKKIAVVGAGFSGLVVSYYLHKLGCSVEVFEKSNRAGGLISTSKTNLGLVESAANGLLNCVELESLCADVGIDLIATNKEARKRFIWRSGRLRRWPLNFSETLRFVTFIWNYYFNRQKVAPLRGETLKAWGARVIGEKASQYTIETAVLGIYAADSQELSAALLLKRFFNSSKPKSTRGKLGRGTVAPLNGMGELIEKLKISLQKNGVQIHFNEIIASSEKLAAFDHVIVATSVDSASELLCRIGDLRGEMLKRITLLPLTSATLFLETKKSVNGFGVLFPRLEDRSSFGVLFNNHIFKNRAYGIESETWILPRTDQNDLEIKNLILSERQNIFSESIDLKDVQINRWPKALPLYNFDLEDLANRMRITEGKVSLLGNYLGEIGLRQILLRAKNLAHEIHGALV